MHIAIATHNVFVGDGQGRVNFELARYLLRLGMTVDLIADAIDPRLVEWGANWIPLHPTVPGTGHSMEGLLLAKVWTFNRMANRYLTANREQYDVVMGCGRTLSVPHSINAVHFVHSAWLRSESHPIHDGIGVQSAYQWLFNRLNARWEVDSLRQAEQILAVSEKVRRELIDAGLPAARIQTVVNGVDVDEFRPGPVDRAALGLPADVPLAFFAGDIRSNRKNLDTVLRAVAQVPSLHLAVAGTLDGSPYPAMAADLEMSDRVHFLGYRRDMPELMRAADVFTFPSRYEACTLALLEALASGLPVITAHTTGGAELISQDCGVVLDDPNDAEALAHGLRRITGDPDARATMQRAARSVAQSHSWERMAQRYVDAFRVVSRHPVPA